MSDINSIILEDISNLKDYHTLNKVISHINKSYKNAIIAHNSNDSNGFINNMTQHRNSEIILHKLLSNPNFLSSGKDHIINRRNVSTSYLSSLSPIG